MATIEQRIADLESNQASADLSRLTDAELDAHLGALKAGTHQWVSAMLTGICRRGSKRLIARLQRNNSYTPSSSHRRKQSKWPPKLNFCHCCEIELP